jgi:hypothetical protein
MALEQMGMKPRGPVDHLLPVAAEDLKDDGVSAYPSDLIETSENDLGACVAQRRSELGRHVVLDVAVRPTILRRQQSIIILQGNRHAVAAQH